jgi:hypothetical protein
VYRIRELFTYLEYNMNVSMLAVTLVRNFTVSRLPLAALLLGHAAGGEGGREQEGRRQSLCCHAAGLQGCAVVLHAAGWLPGCTIPPCGVAGRCAPCCCAACALLLLPLCCVTIAHGT